MSSFPIVFPPFLFCTFPKHMWPNHYLLRISIAKSPTQAADEINFPRRSRPYAFRLLVALIPTSFFPRLLRASMCLSPSGAPL